MELLRTSDKYFENLYEYPFDPNYVEVDGIRIHYVDEGQNDSELVLMLHGEPSWSYLYRNMIPIIKNAGYRVIAPDNVGFGKSDKPLHRSEHTYFKHVQWLTNWLIALELENLTLFCQDWGSLLGLRLVAENPKRFKRVILANGALPTGEFPLGQAFMDWRQECQDMSSFNTRDILQRWTVTSLTEEVLKGYEAPFPDESYKEACRIFPLLVPVSPDDPENERNKAAERKLMEWEKPFLTTFSDKDPITRGGDKIYQAIVPGSKNQPHVTIENAGHFLQEDATKELSQIIIDFIENNPID